MNVPSEEQEHVMEDIQYNNNVVVDACAGSGKSTTVLSCAKFLPSLKFIQITFNKMLQEEVKQSIDKLMLKNIQVYTFHGLAVKYYNNHCHNDMGIRKVMREKSTPRVNISPFDVIVLDETQDMTKLYYDLVWKFLCDMGGPVLFLILGDEKQALYEFKGSDTRFLTMAELCWSHFPNLKSKIFQKRTLQMSYRITDPMREFVNKAMLGYERVKSCKPGPPVVYFKQSIYKFVSIIYGRIQTLLLREKAKYDDFFILLRSIKASNLIVQLLENFLVENGVPCFISTSDEKDELDSRVIQNKVVFSTFHASKGRQRPYVFVMGFDDSHFTYFAPNKDPNICPNEFYVACTRATKMLFLVESKDKSSHKLPFVNMSHNEMMQSSFVSFQGIPCGKKTIQEDAKKTDEMRRKLTPTEMTKFLPETTLDILSTMVDEMFTSLNEPKSDDLLPIVSIHETYNGNFEEVSDINGIALPIMFCDHLKEKSQQEKIPILQNMIRANIKNMDEKHHPFLRKIVNNMPETCETVEEYLYLTSLYSATQECLYSRLKQIPVDNYTWLTNDIVQTCFERMDNTIGKECESGFWTTETYIIQSSDDLGHINIDYILKPYFPDVLYRFNARADLITKRSLWELKCTSQVTLENKLQLIIYAWLYNCKYEKKQDETKEFHLLNIKNNEHLQLQATNEQLTQVIVEIIKGKSETHILSDEEFIQTIKEGCPHNVSHIPQ